MPPANINSKKSIDLSVAETSLPLVGWPGLYIKLPHPEGFNPRTFQRFAPAYYKFLGGGHPIPYFHSKLKRYSKAGSDISISGKLNELRELWDTVGGYLVVGYEGKGGGWALEEWKGRWKLFGVRMWHG
jgi:hypothetical protein